MAKTSSVEKNNRRKRLVKQYDGRRKKLKAVVMDKSRPVEERFEATIKLAEVPRNSAKVRVRNRCDLTGRARGYYRKTQLSRIAMRDLAAVGQIPGMVKASW